MCFSPVIGPIGHAKAAQTTTNDALRQEAGCTDFNSSSVSNCLVVVAYYAMYVFPSWLMGITANLFNGLIGIALSSQMYSNSKFIENAWSIVRDFANLFLIFILLFIGISIILGLHIGGESPKKMLVSLIIMGLLINFSLFFTEVVIDTSNVLGLLFYNQITATANYEPIIQNSITGIDEKDVSGSMIQAFKPQAFNDPTFYASLRTLDSKGNNTVDPSITFTFIIIVGIILLVAAWTFFVAGLSFLGRLVGLWIAIIFAPFAFVTYIVPSLRHIEGIGFDNWLSTLIETAFAAPIFMFFIYLISLITKNSFISNFDPTKETTISLKILFIVIPMMIIMILLLQARKYVEKASGQLGQLAIAGGKLALGAAGAVAFGTVAKAGVQGIGRIGSNIANRPAMDKRDGESRAGYFLRRQASLLGYYKPGGNKEKGSGAGDKASTPPAAGEKTNTAPEGEHQIPINDAAIRNLYGPASSTAAPGTALNYSFTPAQRALLMADGRQVTEPGSSRAGGGLGSEAEAIRQRKLAGTTTTNNAGAPLPGTASNTGAPGAAAPTTAGTAGGGHGETGGHGAGTTSTGNLSLKDRAAMDKGLAIPKIKAMQWLSKSSFDVRNTKLMGLLSKAMGVNFGKGTAGGYEAWRNRQVAKKQKFADSLKMSHAEKALLDRTRQELKDEEEKIRHDIQHAGDVAGRDQKDIDKDIRRELATNSKVVGLRGQVHSQEKVEKNRARNYANIVDGGWGAGKWARSAGFYQEHHLEAGNKIRSGAPIDAEALKKVLVGGSSGGGGGHGGGGHGGGGGHH